MTALHRYKMGDTNPKDNKLVFHSYKKNGGEYWVTKEHLSKIKGHDKYWSVYFLPKENYYGCTNRLSKRMWEHRRNGKCTDDYIVVKEFKCQKIALKYEQELQLKFSANGYCYTEKWRKQNSDRIRKIGEDAIYSKIRKPIICIDTGQVFKGVRDCEKFFNAKSGNLSKHLRGNNNYKTFKNLKFKYYEAECTTGVN